MKKGKKRGAKIRRDLTNTTPKILNINNDATKVIQGRVEKNKNEIKDYPRSVKEYIEKLVERDAKV